MGKPLSCLISFFVNPLVFMALYAIIYYIGRSINIKTLTNVFFLMPNRIQNFEVCSDVCFF